MAPTVFHGDPHSQRETTAQEHNAGTGLVAGRVSPPALIVGRVADPMHYRSAVRGQEQIR